MFSSFMVNTWLAATMVAIVAGVVGFFTVLRGSAFVAHAIPQGAFAGAAGAALLGLNTILGLGVFSLLGALGIGWLGKRGRHDAVTALALSVMLGLGALFLSMSVEYAPEIYALLFGEVYGVAADEIAPMAILGAICVAAIAVLYRPLLLTSAMPEVGEARGVRAYRLEMAFLVVVALATSMTVPVVGAFLMFSLMIAPAGTARSFTDKPAVALALSVVIALVTVWVSIAASYESQWPVSFFVGAGGAVFFGLGRCWSAVRRRAARPRPVLAQAVSSAA
jgi:zinc/manganese transport system permease protein